MTTAAAEQAITKLNGGSPPTTKRMALSNVVRGKLDRPVRVLLYGTEKVGKSTWAAQAPNPIFLCSEDGTANLDVARFPEPHTFSEVLDAVDALIADSKDDFGFKSLILDTVDWLEPLLFSAVLSNAGKNPNDGIESIGYGKGYIAAVDLWRTLLARLDRLRSVRHMHIVLLGHATIKPFNNPQGDNFDRYCLKMNDKSAGVLKEWVDAVLFANYEILTYKADKLGKAKGVGDGARIVHTQKRDAFDAGNRYNLPDTIPLAWEDFWAGVNANSERAGKLRADIEALLPSLPEKVATKVRGSLENVGTNEEKLAQLLDWAIAKANG